MFAQYRSQHLDRHYARLHWDAELEAMNGNGDDIQFNPTMSNLVPESDHDDDQSAILRQAAYYQSRFPVNFPYRDNVSDEDSDRTSNQRYAPSSPYDLEPPPSLLVETAMDNEESLTGSPTFDWVHAWHQKSIVLEDDVARLACFQKMDATMECPELIASRHAMIMSLTSPS
ncbi:hypothetical protein CABS01_11745 [Colletotrichum abscissum]|uniref:Uncharacterized protein n=1 Tax=Colletotrichum abscissum TaxID=1671311 RepID=A0A9P9XC02_9PEZI|nr:uncharacterized protein CABS01_11745 [Colletotrichum abscissum]KAI3548673.1 hypothetical protein CABS02_08203 [Colletotrichum abscissum]KAK1492848.1 hypothetical protein CABS01_11745 [Colletotrichum abscissum]